jgi:23S rRNA pseudouridine1911/1915/1917 synthase
MTIRITKRSGSDDAMRISDLVLHNDHHIIACAKPAGMPVQDDKSGDPSLHRLAQAYCQRDLHVLNRLDRPCSGVVLFAKSPEAAAHLSAQWQQQSITKTYYAIVTPGASPDAGSLTHVMRKRGMKSIAGDPASGEAGRHVSLEYRVIRQLDSYDALEIKTNSGFFHQIRAQLAAAGHPVKGDVKYGARRSNVTRMIYLHCAEITFVHPSILQQQTIVCHVPEDPLWFAAFEI